MAHQRRRRQGHLQNSVVEVAEEAGGIAAASTRAQPDTGLSRLARILFGFGLILAATGSLALCLAFRREKKLRQKVEAGNGDTLPDSQPLGRYAD